MKILVFHSYYGCETGCCGHRVEVTKDGKKFEDFQFGHPWSKEDLRAYATDLAREFIAKQFPECLDTIDWSTVEIEGESEDYGHVAATSGEDCNF